MIQITYKNAAGKIIGRFQPPRGWTLGDLKKEIDTARAAHSGDLRAYMTITSTTAQQERVSA